MKPKIGTNSKTKERDIMKKKRLSCIALLLFLAVAAAPFSAFAAEYTAVSSDGRPLIYYTETENGETTRTQFSIYHNYKKLEMDAPLDYFRTKDDPFDFQIAWVPLRAFCEYLGYTVLWDNENRQVYINSADTPIKYAADPNPDYVGVYIDNILRSVNKVNLNGHYYAEFEALMQTLGLDYEYTQKNCYFFTANPLTDAEKQKTPAIKDRYGPGEYKIGVDIPAGWYELTTEGRYIEEFADGCEIIGGYTEYADGRFVLSGAAFEDMLFSLDEVLSSGVYSRFCPAVAYPNVKSFSKSYIIYLPEGAYFKMINCAAKPFTIDAPKPDGYRYGKGTYEIGRDIPSGEYVLIKDEDADKSTCRIIPNEGLAYSNAITGFPIACDNGPRVIYLHDGRLELSGCSLYPSGNAPDIMGDGMNLGYGVYKAGLQIPAGMYLVQQGEGATGTTFASVYDAYSDKNRYTFRYRYNIEPGTAAEVTIKDGQYISIYGAAANLQKAE